jgi:iron complex outermembrane recepter protein
VTLKVGDVAYSLNPETEGDEEELVVTGAGQQGYRATNSTTATKTDTPIRDIPQSIQVVPRQVLEDQAINRVGDALQNVSGVSNQGAYQGYEDIIYLRGFNVGTFQGGYFRDGIRTFTFGAPDITNLEQIEVLKDPSSVLFGQGQPGGIINLVTKQPLSDRYIAPSLSIGQFDDYRGSLDLSGPLNTEKTVRYRLNLVYNNAGSFRDFVDKERFFLAPVLTWNISPKTSITFDAEYTADSATYDTGLVAIGDRPADIPLSRFLGEPFSEFSKNEFSTGYVFNHRFNENLSVRHNFRAQWQFPERYGPLPTALDETTGELSRFAYWAGGHYENYTTQTDLVSKFATGPVQHQVVVGFEFQRTVEKPEFLIGPDYPSINIFDPVYARQEYPKEPNFFRDDITDTYGVYLQDQVTLLRNLKLLAGVRFDSFIQNRSTQDLGAPKQESQQSDSAFSPRFGLVYQPIEPVSLYASYTRSFLPGFGANADGSVFKPEVGEQFEIGVKADIKRNLSLTLATYQLKKKNIVTDDPDDPTGVFQIQTGEQTSKGIEFDLVGEILPGWNMIASAAYTDARITKDNVLEVGNQLDNFPEWSASLWTTYEI